MMMKMMLMLMMMMMMMMMMKMVTNNDKDDMMMTNGQVSGGHNGKNKDCNMLQQSELVTLDLLGLRMWPKHLPQSVPALCVVSSSGQPFLHVVQIKQAFVGLGRHAEELVARTQKIDQLHSWIRPRLAEEIREVFFHCPSPFLSNLLLWVKVTLHLPDHKDKIKVSVVDGPEDSVPVASRIVEGRGLEDDPSNV